MKDTIISDCYIIEIPKIIAENDSALSVIEKDVIPFELKRFFYLYNIPTKAKRGVHAHKELTQFLIAIHGSFEVVLKDGKSQKRFLLNKPNEGLLIPSGVWTELEGFSSDAVCLVAASDIYYEEDYIRDYNKFLDFKGTKIS